MESSTDEVWRKLDPGLWEITRNPWVEPAGLIFRAAIGAGDSGARKLLRNPAKKGLA